jgi:hypothetical protein
MCAVFYIILCVLRSSERILHVIDGVVNGVINGFNRRVVAEGAGEQVPSGIFKV